MPANYDNPRELNQKQRTVCKFVCEKLEDGLCLTEICRQFPTKVPTQATLWRWRRTDEKFRKEFDTSYETLIHRRVQEIDDLSGTKVPSLIDVANEYGLIDHKGNLDLRAANMQLGSMLQARKIRIDALKFLTATIAPKISDEFRNTRQLDVNVKTEYQIMDFSKHKDDEKIINAVPEMEELEHIQEQRLP